ncbi:hypothetical protein [Burkholderia glumae]|uniref:hypothetical protein n=1 Tax=Burkholderia glumae TaxID=337 RepID=UPI0004241EB3|nr:hypothetical protein [Burkholderia glumae]QKM57755.1 hypothetical protein CG017_05835 [Burkholderia glumae]
MNPLTSVDYETACAVIGQLIAHQVAIVAHEEQQPHPNVERATAAEAERRSLMAVRDQLHPDDASAIAQALADYGPRAKLLASVPFDPQK